jgi:hypothetical protein
MGHDLGGSPVRRSRRLPVFQDVSKPFRHPCWYEQEKQDEDGNPRDVNPFIQIDRVSDPNHQEQQHQREDQVADPGSGASRFLTLARVAHSGILRLPHLTFVAIQCRPCFDTHLSPVLLIGADSLRGRSAVQGGACAIAQRRGGRRP